MSPWRSDDVGDEVERLRESVRRRPLIDQDRLRGKTPIKLEKVGPENYLEIGTDAVSSGATKSVYLTVNSEARGRNVLGPTPIVQVFRSTEGIQRAGGPSSPSKTLRLTHHTSYDLVWDGANEVWYVEITNDSGASAGFTVKARGLD